MTSLSQLVNAMLEALPSAESGAESGLPTRTALAPAVRRLLGAASPRPGARDTATGTADDPRAAFRAHLVEKYGGAA